jgi:hypothetical protein
MAKTITKQNNAIKPKMIDGVLTINVAKKDAGEQYKSISGVEDKLVFDALLMNAARALSALFAGDDKYNVIISMLSDISPQDGLESMLASQMITTHFLSLEMMRRATLPEQTPEGVSENLNRATKLQRTYVQQLEALQKKRNKGQVIQVQHVNVESGGQAVVGNVTTGGGK